MHGSSASVSAPSTNRHGAATATTTPASPAPAITPTAPLSRFHHLSGPDSRPHSISSSSVVTIKRTASLSSNSTGPRNSLAPMRPQSPVEPSLIALRMGRDSAAAQDRRRRKSVAIDPSEHGAANGLDNLNRWSHSTNSSVASIVNTRRSRASSGAALQTIAAQHLASPSSATRSRNPIHDGSPTSQRGTPPRPTSQRRLYSPDQSPSPQRHRQRPSRPEFANAITALPPLQTTPALTDPNDTESPSTIPTVATPSTHSSSYDQDYFVANDGSAPPIVAKNKRPAMIRNHTAPMSVQAHQRSVASDPPRATFNRRSTMPPQEEEAVSLPRAPHAREGSGHHRSRTREGKEKDKKAMLSKALQKANTAVLLDNAQNFEGALDAYSDACALLQQVMDRSSVAEDKKKLESIRITYTNRIEELRQLDLIRPNSSDDKDLPARPMSDDSLSLGPSLSADNNRMSRIAESIRDSAVIETATAKKIADVPRLSYPENSRDSFFSRTMAAVESSSRSAEEAKPRSMTDDEPAVSKLELEHDVRIDSRQQEVQQEDTPSSEIKTQTLQLPTLDNTAFIPAPLSPRKPLSPMLEPESVQTLHEPDPAEEADAQAGATQAGGVNDSSGSWLDTIDESGSSCASSIHSKSSGQGLRRKHIRGASNDTNPDFDAAFDAAVEAAYDEGLEPDLGARKQRNPALRHTANVSISVPSDEIKEVLSPTNAFHPMNSMYTDLNDEEEERLLDEITSDYAQGFNFDMSTKSALPRQSDSSAYSRSTWQSSQTSTTDRTTAATSLSTVEEDVQSPALLTRPMTLRPPATPPQMEPPPPPTAPPPTGALPKIPQQPTHRLSGVRSRRLSGQPNPKQLKIETSVKPDVRKRASTLHASPSEVREVETDSKFGASLEPTPSEVRHEHILQSPPSLDMRSAASEKSTTSSSVTRPQTAITTAAGRRQSLEAGSKEILSARPAVFRKNKSSISLRGEHGLPTSPDDSGLSAATPMSSMFLSYSKQNGPDPLTTQRANFSSVSTSALSGLHTNGAQLFDTSLSTTRLPTSPRSPTTSSQPASLEPCPESYLLRPFWLMRTIAATLTHPKGGFLTNRLFIPREAWQTRNVKLKSVEDKVANCDLLTAALGRLANVDTYDADAVMEELQSFEEVMERVQAALTKKLGSDVGVHGVMGLFKDAAPANSNNPGASFSSTGTASGLDSSFDGSISTGSERTTAPKSKEGKSYLNSWRKLRSKSSGVVPLGGSTNTQAKTYQPLPQDPTHQQQYTMPSVPTTNFIPVERRGGGPKRDVRSVVFEGPHKEYMGSLARLLEGAQVLDLIARQVEDPGLKHSSPTHVGLELSMRHAAEFFGFYICRFVLADLGVLVDKFVKRGTEWVLA